MTGQEARAALVAIWLRKAEETLLAAETLLLAGQAWKAVGQLYYACFYAITAMLLHEGKSFARHGDVLGEFNRSYVKSGKVDRQWGKFCERLFRDRAQADYLPTVQFDDEDISDRLRQSREFVEIIRNLTRP